MAFILFITILLIVIFKLRALFIVALIATVFAIPKPVLAGLGLTTSKITSVKPYATIDNTYANGWK